MLTRRYPISITEAQAKINQVALPTKTETIPVTDANHRVLAETVTAPFAYPHFRRSGVDGFAIRHEDASIAWNVRTRHDPYGFIFAKGLMKS